MASNLCRLMLNDEDYAQLLVDVQQERENFQTRNEEQQIDKTVTVVQAGNQVSKCSSTTFLAPTLRTLEFILIWDLVGRFWAPESTIHVSISNVRLRAMPLHLLDPWRGMEFLEEQKVESMWSHWHNKYVVGRKWSMIVIIVLLILCHSIT